MHVGRTPFVNKDRKHMYHAIIKKDPEYPATFPPLAKDLCNKLLWYCFSCHLLPAMCLTPPAANRTKVASGPDLGEVVTSELIPIFAGWTSIPFFAEMW